MESIETFVRLFPQSLIAGIVIASVCGFLGVFVILKRVVFIGITLSEVAACGIAAAMMLNVHPFIGASVLTLATTVILSHSFETDRIPRDAILGVIFVAASALSILLVAKSGFGLHEVRALLYGDLILTSDKDLTIILVALLPILVCLFAFIRPILYTFLDREASRVLQIRVVFWEFLFFLALGLTVSAASKVAGALLVFCYLVVAPSTALLLSRQLWLVIVISICTAVVGTISGMFWSFSRDLPTNQSIAITVCVFFGVALLIRWLRRVVRRISNGAGGAECPPPDRGRARS